MSLEGQTALVTGGGTGIGAAIALALARAGADLVLAGRRQAPLEKVRGEIEALGRRALAQTCDVRDAGQVEALKAAAKDAFGPVDVLVNNAGIGLSRPVLEVREADFQAVFDTNVKGVHLCCRAFVPDMQQRGRGAVVMVSSLAGKRPFVGGGIYSASKAALMSYAEILRQEVRRDGVRVIVVCPGTVATPFFDQPGFNPPVGNLQAGDVADLIVAALSLPERALVSEFEIRPAIPK